MEDLQINPIVITNLEEGTYEIIPPDPIDVGLFLLKLAEIVQEKTKN